ncbi:hypothetical protein STEG23_020565 [Scotinomys teguina]
MTALLHCSGEDESVRMCSAEEHSPDGFNPQSGLAETEPRPVEEDSILEKSELEEEKKVLKKPGSLGKQQFPGPKQRMDILNHKRKKYSKSKLEKCVNKTQDQQQELLLWFESASNAWSLVDGATLGGSRNLRRWDLAGDGSLVKSRPPGRFLSLPALLFPVHYEVNSSSSHIPTAKIFHPGSLMEPGSHQLSERDYLASELQDPPVPPSPALILQQEGPPSHETAIEQQLRHRPNVRKASIHGTKLYSPWSMLHSLDKTSQTLVFGNGD